MGTDGNNWTWAAFTRIQGQQQLENMLRMRKQKVGLKCERVASEIVCPTQPTPPPLDL